MVRDDIRVRRVVPGDAAELERFYAELSAESRVLRFHGASRGIRHAQAEKFAAADHQQCDSFVAVAGGRIVGHIVLSRSAKGRRSWPWPSTTTCSTTASGRCYC